MKWGTPWQLQFVFNQGWCSQSVEYLQFFDDVISFKCTRTRSKIESSHDLDKIRWNFFDMMLGLNTFFLPQAGLSGPNSFLRLGHIMNKITQDSLYSCVKNQFFLLAWASSITSSKEEDWLLTLLKFVIVISPRSKLTNIFSQSRCKISLLKQVSKHKSLNKSYTFLFISFRKWIPLIFLDPVMKSILAGKKSYFEICHVFPIL